MPKKKRDGRKKYTRKVGSDRPTMSYRTVLCAILYLLKTGIQWKAIPRECLTSIAIYQYLVFCMQSGFFDKLQKLGLVMYNEMIGIAWKLQVVDSSHHKASRTEEDSEKRSS